jgi:hypothetical protein
LYNLQLLNVLGAENMTAKGTAERIVEQCSVAAILVALGRTERGLVDEFDGWGEFWTL